ncbi:MAG: hypothetical protein K8U57_37105 [Planctomycetes bacterium]|nr:hypothetical protein [Planctomycetota bacterium]
MTTIDDDCITKALKELDRRANNAVIRGTVISPRREFEIVVEAYLASLPVRESITPAPALSEEGAVRILGNGYMLSGRDNGYYSSAAMTSAYRALSAAGYAVVKV